MKVATYVRVSTLNGQDPEMQTNELRDYCERRKWKISKEYVDVGISGSKEKRPELDRLMEDAHRQRFDIVIVWRFDRFARNVSHLLRALETFRAQGIEFVSLSEQIDTATPMGKMLFTVLGSFAELERSLIRERFIAGIRNARSKGVRLGRPPKISNVDQINLLRKKGASWRTVGLALGVSSSTAFCAFNRASKKAKLRAAIQ